MANPPLPPLMSRRKNQRLACTLAARWLYGGAGELGYVTNLSPTGLCLRTRRLHKPGFEADVTLTHDGGEATVRARVLWTRQLQVESHINVWHEMGMSLAEGVPEAYRELLHAVANPPVERRKHRRFNHSMRVTVFWEQEEFQARSVDVSRNGVLVLADAQPPVASEVRVVMVLPGTRDPVEVQARVVRILEAPGPDTLPGFAVQFLGLGKGEEQTFLNYLRIVRELRSLARSV